MKKLFTIITLFIGLTSNAQNIQWANSANGPSVDLGTVNCVDAAGNVYFGGTYTSSLVIGGFSQPDMGSSSSTKVFIAKYTKLGVLLWAKSFGGTLNTTINSMCTDAFSNNLFVTGNFSNASITIGTLTPISNAGSTDVYVASFVASSGNAAWSLSDGGVGADDGKAIVYSSTGIYVAGTFDGASALFGTTTLTNAASGTSDLFISKYSTSSGAFISAIRAGGTNLDVVTDMDIDGSNNLYLSGYFQGTSTYSSSTITSSGATKDPFLLKYATSSSTWLWAKSAAGSTYDDFGYGVSVDAAGSNVFLTGSYAANTLSLSAITLTNTAFVINKQNGFVAKYNGSGTIQWAQSIGSNFTAIANDIDNDAAGNCYAAYKYSPVNGTYSYAKVNKYNSVGTLIWNVNLYSGGGSTGSANKIAVDSKDNVYTCGTFFSTITLAAGTITLTSLGSSDAFLLKIACISPTITSVLSASVCPGASITLDATGATSYTWSTGVVSSSIVITPTASVNYSVVGTSTLCGDATSYPFSVTLLPASISAGTDLNLACRQTQTLNAISNPTAPTSVIWSPATGLSNTTILNPVVTGSNTALNYVVTATLTNGCVAKDSVNVSTIVTVPQICEVTVDSLSQFNNILWDKTLYANADSFIVYREVSTNIYKRIGAQAYAALSLFVDTARSVGPANGEPNITSYRYKLQLRDSCGNYSALSPYHNSIYFITNTTGTFFWNSYNIEGQPNTPVSTFDLLRDNNATGTWTVVGSCAGTQTSLNDPAFNSYPNAVYRVYANGFNCSPTAKTAQQVNRSKSNVKNNFNSIPTGIITNQLNTTINIAPNPVITELIISFTSEINTITKIYVTDVLGKQVFNSEINNGKSIIIPVNELTSGIYFVKIEQGKNYTIKKFIKE